jgi:predicted CoA-binding protein
MISWQDILRKGKSIAIVGLSPKTWRASYGVAKYLKDAGYRIYPVNPELLSPFWGLPVSKNLSEIHEVDVINVFRKSEDLSGLVHEICELPWAPKMCWFQVNMRLELSDEQRLTQKGILVVKDKCLMVEHRLMD